MADSSTLITEVSRRLRDPNNERHARTLVRDVMSQCQRIVNLVKRDKVASSSFTPTAGRTLYATSEVAATIARIITIRQFGRDLHEVAFGELAHVEHRWLRATGKRYELFARVGGDLFTLTPALDTPVAVDVVYVTAPTDLTDGAGDVVISDEYIPLLLDMTELVLAMRVRLWQGSDELLDRIKRGLGYSAEGAD
jgi:hypothetical protein